MIRDYIKGDMDKLKPNEFSNFSGFKNILLNPKIEKITIENDGKIEFIIGMYNYWGDCWNGFFLLDEQPSNIKEIKNCFDMLVLTKKPQRVETYSEDCKIINRWMEFLGFTCEGLKKKYMYNKDYRMWSMLWE